MVRSKGLGDSVEKVLKATGIDKVAKKVLGDDCGCQKRKEALNKLYPYSRQMTEDEMKIYEEIMSRTKDTITKQDQALLVKIYNKVFNKNKKPSSCGSCVKNTLNELKKVYENSCKN
jgi:arginyl-tRNA synthetase|tara:strand:+ start:402 stop:752 length:351 start_codon:yes stop_codon:yes gene_type:complete